MAQVSPILRIWTDAAGTRRVLYWCPGCEEAHHVPVNRPGGDRPNWSFDENFEAPTLFPSVRHFYPANRDQPERTLCHYFIKEGQIQFCGDCIHGLNGQTVPLPPLPPPDKYGYPDED